MEFPNKPILRLIIGVIGSGKDHAAERFFNSFPKDDYILPYLVKFASQMTKLAAKIYSADFSTKEKYEAWKSIPENREKLVNLAEGMKEIHGKTFWISQTLIELKDLLNQSVMNMMYPVFAISDFRFVFEYWAIKAFCEENGILLEVEYVNFVSNRYEMRRDHPGEQLALYLVDNDYGPGVWTPSEFETVIHNYTTNTHEKTLNHNRSQN